MDIELYKGSEFDYLQKDDVANCRQSIVLNESSTLTFDLLKKSEKWKYFDGAGLTAEVNGRVYCIIGDDSAQDNRDNSDKLSKSVSMKELWYKLTRKYITAANVNVPNSEIDHIDKHMVVLLGNSKDPLTINGTRVTAPYEVGTAQYMFWCITRSSGWELDGRYDAYWPDGKFDLETDKKSVLENIQLLQTLYGGMLFWDTKNKRVALVDEKKYLQNDGFQVEYGYNLKGITRSESRDIITRLYVYGNANLNFESINGGRDYLDNFSYTSEILEGHVKHNDIYTQEFLLDWGKRESERLCKPRYTYGVDLLLYQGVEGAANLSIGNLATIYDPDIAPTPVTQRIVAIDQDPFNPSDCKVNIGEIAETFEGVLVDLLAAGEKAKDSISDSGKIPGEIIQGKTPSQIKDYQHWGGVTSGLGDRITQEIKFVNSTITDVEKGLQTSITQTAAQIRLEARDMEKGLQASISITAGEIRSEVRGVQNGLSSSISQTASQIRSEVRDVEKGLQSSITQNANRIALVVSGNGIRAAEIVASINGSSSSVKISADHVDIRGYVTFSDLNTSGRTTIHGGNITTGTISADRIASNSITSVKIASNAITSDKIAANAITANKIAANAITADKISATAVTSKFTHSTNIQTGNINFNGVIIGYGNGGELRNIAALNYRKISWTTLSINGTSRTVLTAS